MIQIQRKPDLSIEPGHQVLVLPYSEEGCAMARLLTGEHSLSRYLRGEDIQIPHDSMVDARIVDLINTLADIRYQAPQLLQLTMVESVQPFLQILPRKEA